MTNQDVGAFLILGSLLVGTIVAGVAANQWWVWFLLVAGWMFFLGCVLVES